MTRALSGRQAQAARNDEVILAAARAVFVADPSAPISAVAERAGVGISALYRRYASKEELLRKLCSDGLARYSWSGLVQGGGVEDQVLGVVVGFVVVGAGAGDQGQAGFCGAVEEVGG